MDAIDKLNKIERLMKYYSEGQRNRSLNKMAGRITDKMFKDLCTEYEICNVCGKGLDKDGTFAIWQRHPNNHMKREVKSPACPDNDCQYNKDKTDSLQYEENWKGALYR